MLFYKGVSAYAIIVTHADQFQPQLLLEQFNTLPKNVDSLNICMKELVQKLF